MDLRYADGSDFESAVAVANLFATKKQPLLNWGSGIVSSEENKSAIKLPVAVLVNHETSRAAEALAAALRETGAAVILGSRTAGEAMVTQDFPLKNGQQLRIGTSPVTLGDGTPMPAEGVKPDIAVQVSAKTERAYYANAFWTPANLPAGARGGGSASATNASSRRVRFNEAELVREHKLGLDSESGGGGLSMPQESKPAAPVVTDPLLARALDLLKGLAVVRQDSF